MRAFHRELPISSIPTGAPSFSESAIKCGVTFLQDQIARLFGRTLVDANAAATHLVHHRQEIDFKPVGVARSFAIEDRIEIFP